MLVHVAVMQLPTMVFSLLPIFLKMSPSEHRKVSLSYKAGVSLCSIPRFGIFGS